jgi:predicted KAP-like P-loop ATPase
MWADNETSEDLLGFKVHADLLIDVINDESVLPVTIGVFGDWGSGKSSILKIINDQLSGENEDDLKDGTLVLYFNGWIFEGYDDAKAALLESIIEKFDNHKTLGNKVKDRTTKLLKSVNWMRVLGLGFKKVVLPATAAYVTGGASIIPSLLSSFSELNSKDLTDKLRGDGAEEYLKSLIKDEVEEDSTLVREFRDDFKEMINKSEIKKLVVIIDDLDRCTPERIIENLEAIKLFLNVDKTAFIIGADPRIVRHAIEHRYKTDSIENSNDPESRNNRIVSDYLEKLIQIPYNLPKLSDHEVETYMTLLFCKKELENDFSNVLKAFYEYREANRYGVFGFGNFEDKISEEQKSRLENSVSLVVSLSSIITQGLNGNPRQIKRFLNTFNLRKRLVDVAKISDVKSDILAKIMVLEYSNTSLFRKIYEWQALQNGIPNEITELEKLAKELDYDTIKSKFSAEWGTDKIIKWLNVEPKLSNVDLRDYYWISRDQLTSSISGSSLIPEHIRGLFKKLKGHPSASILSTTIKRDVLSLTNPADSQSLLMLLERELVKQPEEESIHKVFIQAISDQAIDYVETYARALKVIDHKLIPYHLSNQIKIALQKNTRMQEIIKLFKNDSKIAKSLKEE